MIKFVRELKAAWLGYNLIINYTDYQSQLVGGNISKLLLKVLVPSTTIKWYISFAKILNILINSFINRHKNLNFMLKNSTELKIIMKRCHISIQKLVKSAWSLFTPLINTGLRCFPNLRPYSKNVPYWLVPSCKKWIKTMTSFWNSGLKLQYFLPSFKDYADKANCYGPRQDKPLVQKL